MGREVSYKYMNAIRRYSEWKICATLSRMLKCALALLSAFTLHAATPQERVRSIITSEMDRQHIAGLAVAIVQTGHVVHAAGFGLADVENKVPASSDTVFKIGSISKQFLATGVLLLAEESKLAIDDKVSLHLEGTPTTWSNITLRHLLSHTAGLIRECPAFNRWLPVSDAEAVRSAYDVPLAFATGSRYQYSNCGYFSLAEIITRRSGQPWAAFIEARVFTPAGMKQTRTTSTTDLIPKRARGYEWQSNHWQNAADYVAVRPSGAFVSSVLDLARWDAVLLRGDVLSKQMQERMWTPVPLTTGTNAPYGLGWSLDSFQGRRRVHHGGSLPGFRSHYMKFPDEGLTVIVLANEDGAKAQPITERVAAVYLTE